MWPNSSANRRLCFMHIRTFRFQSRTKPDAQNDDIQNGPLQGRAVTGPFTDSVSGRSGVVYSRETRRCYYGTIVSPFGRGPIPIAYAWG